MEELLAKLIRWSQIAAISASIGAVIVLFSHWPRHLRLAWDEPKPTPVRTDDADCVCEQPRYHRQSFVARRTQHLAPPQEPLTDEQPEVSTPQFVGTPVSNMQPNAFAAPARVTPEPEVVVVDPYSSPRPVVRYGGAQWGLSVTVRQRPRHAWPRRSIGGIGHGIGRVFGIRHR
jgi:hypothetical protein